MKTEWLNGEKIERPDDHDPPDYNWVELTEDGSTIVHARTIVATHVAQDLSAGVKRMSVAQFRKLGYLQEVNRLILHPLGLALEVVLTPDGREAFGEVWDYRHEEDGMIFGDGVLDSEDSLEKAKRVEDELVTKGLVREKLYGWVIQPIEVKASTSESTSGPSESLGDTEEGS